MGLDKITLEEVQVLLATAGRMGTGGNGVAYAGVAGGGAGGAIAREGLIRSAPLGQVG
jgi:hypothetical protein